MGYLGQRMGIGYVAGQIANLLLESGVGLCYSACFGRATRLFEMQIGRAFTGRVPCKPSPRTWSDGEPSSHKWTFSCVWVNPADLFESTIYDFLFTIWGRKDRSMNRQELMERIKQFAHRGVKLALALPANALGRPIR